MMNRLDFERIRGQILDLAAKNRQVIYGARSINFFLPKRLEKKTKDYDILTKSPEKYAKKLASALNKIGNEERFEVIPARYSKTFKVKDKLTGETIVDYTRTTKKPSAYNELGIRYANLSYSANKLKNILKNESYKFRHDKDLDTLRRIKESGRGFK